MRSRRRTKQTTRRELVWGYRKPALAAGGFLSGVLLALVLSRVLEIPAFGKSGADAKPAPQASPLLYEEEMERAKACEARGDKDGAEEHYMRAAEMASSKAEPLFRLGRISEARNHNEVAISRYRKALERNPSFGAAAHYLAIQLRGVSRYDEAIQMLEATLRREPQNAGLRCNLARTYLEKGDGKRSAEEFHKAIPTVEQKPQAYYFLGKALELERKYGEAEEAYRNALKWNPQLHRAWYALAQLARREGDEKKAQTALRQFEKARALADRIKNLAGQVSRHPADVRSLLQYAKALLDGGRPGEAIEPLKRAAKLDPDNPALEPLRQRTREELAKGRPTT